MLALHWRTTGCCSLQNTSMPLAGLHSEPSTTMASVTGSCGSLMDAGEKFCSVWFGVDPDNGWGFDGLIRFGDPDAEAHVWQTYQRNSYGAYRRLSSLCANAGRNEAAAGPIRNEQSSLEPSPRPLAPY